MRFKTLGRDAFIYGLSTLLTRGQQIVLIPIYTRFLGTAEYGAVEAMAIFGALVNLTVALEISQGVARYLADAPDLAARRRYAFTALLFSLFCYSVFVVVLALLSSTFAEWLFEGQAGLTALMVGVGALAVNGVFVLVQDILRWQLRPMAYFLAGAAYAFGGGIVGVGFVVAGFGVSGVFLGQLAGALAGFVIALFASRSLWRHARFDFGALKQMLGFSAPLVVSSLAVFAGTFTDRIVVRELLGLEALGMYAVSARFASVVAILTVGLQAALTPLVYRTWREPGAAQKLAQVFRIYLAGMVPVIGVLALFSSEIVSMVVGNAFLEASVVLPVQAAASLFLSLYVFAPGLFLGKRTVIAAVVNLGGAAMNLALCLWLTVAMGLIGAALSATIAAACVFAGHVSLGRRYFDVPLDRPGLLLSFGALGALVATGVEFSATYSMLDPASRVLKAAVLCLVTAVVWAFSLKSADRALILAAWTGRVFNYTRGK